MMEISHDLENAIDNKTVLYIGAGIGVLLLVYGFYEKSKNKTSQPAQAPIQYVIAGSNQPSPAELQQQQFQDQLQLLQAQTQAQKELIQAQASASNELLQTIAQSQYNLAQLQAQTQTTLANIGLQGETIANAFNYQVAQANETASIINSGLNYCGNVISNYNQTMANYVNMGVNETIASMNDLTSLSSASIQANAEVQSAQIQANAQVQAAQIQANAMQNMASNYYSAGLESQGLGIIGNLVGGLACGLACALGCIF